MMAPDAYGFDDLDDRSRHAPSAAFIVRLLKLRPHHYIVGSVLISLFMTSSCSILFHGYVTRDYIITGSIVSLVVSSIIISLISVYQREIEARNRLLEIEKLRSERLLLNVLPPEIAVRLKRGEEVIADYHEEVAVLFADIVGFTRLADRLPVGRVVEILNHTFCAFDAIAEKYGLEKIKTIGDAYMVVGGLLEARGDPHGRVAAMALEMQAESRRLSQVFDEPLNLRIGMHSGHVIAGVIGRTRFSYDLWGDTVNTASRMESHGIEGRIHVSEEVWRRLRTTHHLEARGEIDIKGKGRMRTWFLLSRQPAAGALP